MCGYSSDLYMMVFPMFLNNFPELEAPPASIGQGKPYIETRSFMLVSILFQVYYISLDSAIPSGILHQLYQFP